MCSLFIEAHLAAEEVFGVKASEYQVGIGNGRLRALAVTGRSRVCSGALRSDPQGAALIHMGDRTAPGTDGMDVNDRDADKLARRR